MSHHMSIDCLAHYRDDGTGYKWNKLDNLIPMHDMIDGHLDTVIDGDYELNFNQVTYRLPTLRSSSLPDCTLAHCLSTLHSGPLPDCALAHCLSTLHSGSLSVYLGITL